jgi:GNAT superfamily N-acetyltransferase
MTLRNATIEDLPQLSECAREFYASSRVLKTFDIDRFCETWTRFLYSEMGVIFLLVEGEEILGTIGGVAYMEPYSQEMIAQEFWWYVLKESRGAGVRLYRAFEEWATERGCSRLRMGHLVDSMPEKVAHFYERIGLQREEVVYSKSLVA